MNLQLKEYKQQWNWLFNPSKKELIPSDYTVRVVNCLVEQLDLTLLSGGDHCK